MTRETKIGLLVGLAFIIVIGILLSDHMTSSTEPPKAPLSVAGNNLRESVTTPAAPSGAPAIAALGGAATGVLAPNQTVPTAPELSQPRVIAPPSVQVGPGAAPAQGPVVVQQAPLQQQQQQPGTPQISVGPAAPQQQPQQPPVVLAQPPAQQQPLGHPLQGVATRNGEELVPLGTPPGQVNLPAQPPSARQQQQPPVPMAPLREYKAQAGDSLSKLAGRFMGGNTKANRDAIVRVNPTLQQNPDKIVEGRTYVLPPMPAQTADAAPAAPAPAAPAPVVTPAPRKDAPAARAPETASPAGEAFTWYTVKENENLWKIAAEQLGSGNAWTQIRDLNQDVLKGEDQVRVNTKIRLPNKPVASAAH